MAGVETIMMTAKDLNIPTNASSLIAAGKRCMVTSGSPVLPKITNIFEDIADAKEDSVNICVFHIYAPIIASDGHSSACMVVELNHLPSSKDISSVLSICDVVTSALSIREIKLQSVHQSSSVLELNEKLAAQYQACDQHMQLLQAYQSQWHAWVSLNSVLPDVKNESASEQELEAIPPPTATDISHNLKIDFVDIPSSFSSSPLNLSGKYMYVYNSE
jgi:hypothetical protein